MKLEALHLENVRGFERLDLDFDEKLTVLVGVNGSGKTTVLDATADLIAKARQVGGLLGVFNEESRRRGSSKLPSGQLEFTAADGVRSVVRSEGISVKDGGLAARAEARQSRTVVAYYRSTPVVETAYSISQPPAPGDHEARTALHGNTSSALFFDWYREREEAENFTRSRKGDLTYWDPLLKATREAIYRLLPGTSDLHIERNPVRMVIEKDGQQLGVGSLSDGEKRLLAICGDLATRLALANEKAESPLEGEAIVLIDEVELHLHPSWQRVVLERLGQAFPNAQLVVTTHSPTVLGAVEPRSIRLLRNFSVVPFEGHTRGRNADALLREVMGVPERSDEAAAKLRDIAVMIDDERLDEAKQALEQLASWLGQEDSEIVRLTTLIGFLEGERAVDPQGP